MAARSKFAARVAAVAVLLPMSSFAADDARVQLGKTLFTAGATPACALCHVLKDAGTDGQIGPALDEIKPDASRVVKALRNGIGQMPSFQALLTEEQIQALAAYVAKATGAAR